MGRGRGKGKKQSTLAYREDPGSGEEEKTPPHKRRGRPQKPLKDEIEEEERAEKIEQEEEEEEEEGENSKGSISNKHVKNQAAVETGRKRKRSSQAKENPGSVKEENGVGTKTRTDDSVKSVGFRQNGSRRKNKPQRAAEVGVECT
ncbi:uncharacterized protein LOC127789595 [Diospyros lotus]|uniref:uncharacterized protein LOC127789595 n=1 Tax=Diospyros lotus TaxID=55363 RepID=UPI00225A8F28|nr:uncharacterized protein LOC127789595 [Diospyros lotus]XP_052174491.1 uncharacterized protein LOC127789595 [Diospyros lotus]